MQNVNPGLFIVFEGGEGSGKSTQARNLVDALNNHDIRAMFTHEPGSTALGKDIRGLLLDRKNKMTSKTEALLFAADRAEHVKKVIKPHLDDGYVVVCDRYSASSIAYQAYAGELNVDRIIELSEWVADGLQPDLTFYLDIDPETGLERSRRKEITRFEDKTLEYHKKVQRGFDFQKDNSWVTIDAHDSVMDIHEKIFAHVMSTIAVIRRVHGRLVADTKEPETSVTEVSEAIRDPSMPRQILSVNPFNAKMTQTLICPIDDYELWKQGHQSNDYVCPGCSRKFVVVESDEEPRIMNSSV